ncbi:MAG: glycosyltransferase [Pseudomonadota bacterium]
MKVAIIHYWLVGMRGGEKVLEALCDLYPEADIFTHVYDPESVSEKIRRHRVHTTFISRLPRSKKYYRQYLPLMPMALEQLDLSDYDLVISSESGPAKGIIPREDAVHICYCHTPMRYLWNMYTEHYRTAGFLTRAMMPTLCHYLRNWDVSSAARVDAFIANSNAVSARIRKYYRRESTVIHPPVQVEKFTTRSHKPDGDFYLVAGELVRYKRPDLAVEAFNKMGRKLIVVGGGEMQNELSKLAGPTVEVLGRVSFDELQYYLSNAHALIFPGEEDFGILPVEAMASGCPVIAYARGGALDTVEDGVTGVLFDQQSPEAIMDAVWQFEQRAFSPQELRQHANRFDTDRFKSEILNFVEQAIESNRQFPLASRPKTEERQVVAAAE